MAEHLSCMFCDGFKTRDGAALEAHIRAAHADRIRDDGSIRYEIPPSIGEGELAMAEKPKDVQVDRTCPQCKKVYPYPSFLVKHVSSGKCPKTGNPVAASASAWKRAKKGVGKTRPARAARAKAHVVNDPDTVPMIATIEGLRSESMRLRERAGKIDDVILLLERIEEERA